MKVLREKKVDDLKILTVVIAAGAAMIAWWQYQTAAAKLKLDLFERRLRVYEGLMRLLGEVVAGPGEKSPLSEFYAATNEKRFLFDSDITDYLKEVKDNVIKLRQAQRKHGTVPDGKARDAAIEADQ
jgi:hypothetical protein